jgi:hypothetical protein
MAFLYPRNDWKFVDQTSLAPEEGSFLKPYQSVPTAMQYAPAGSTLQMQPGTYTAAGTYDKPMVLRVPLEHVTLGQ